MSRDGIRALVDNGIKVTYASYGEKSEFSGNQAELPYGHSFRYLHNKKPETGVYKKRTRDLAIASALCSYNHIPEDKYLPIHGKFKTVKDPELDVYYMPSVQAVLNLIPLDILEQELNKFTSQEYVGIGNHEQYYYSDYYAYQPDYAEKIYLMGKIMKEAGYEFIFAEDLPC